MKRKKFAKKWLLIKFPKQQQKLSQISDKKTAKLMQ
jgi:hypothetical protein